ncbi:MAG TPA: hypothetical protein VI541_03380, partial [Actinomycetota bacterium]|nr:hypothetical protein [Actinomycetota bacterium]
STEGYSEEVLLAVFSNIPEFTYFNNLPLLVAPKASLEAGLDVYAMRRFPMHYIPALAWSIFRSGTHIRYKHASYIHDRTHYSLSSSGPAFPVQVDGEYIGDRTEVVIEQVPNGLAILV